jgi:hypothetical protein
MTKRTVMDLLCSKQDELWERDAKLFEDQELDPPLGYALWAFPDMDEVVVAETRLGPDPQEWEKEVARWMDVLGAFFPSTDFHGLITVGIGSVKGLEDTEEDAQNLMCIHAGLKVSDLPGASKHLICSLQVEGDSGASRLLAAPILDIPDISPFELRKSRLGELLDSGSCPVVVTRA